MMKAKQHCGRLLCVVRRRNDALGKLAEEISPERISKWRHVRGGWGHHGAAAPPEVGPQVRPNPLLLLSSGLLFHPQYGEPF